MLLTLGEIPDEVAALRELRRLLKQRGRVVIGEVLINPDYVSPRALEEKAKDAGFVLEHITGQSFPTLRYSALRRSSNSDRLFLVFRRIAIGNLIRFALEQPEEFSVRSGLIKCQVIGECISCARARTNSNRTLWWYLATGPAPSVGVTAETTGRSCCTENSTPDALTSGRATVPVGKPKRVVSKRVATWGTGQMMQSFRQDKRSIEATAS